MGSVASEAPAVDEKTAADEFPAAARAEDPAVVENSAVDPVPAVVENPAAESLAVPAAEAGQSCQYGQQAAARAGRRR
jgi:hypothetical protein